MNPKLAHVVLIVIALALTLAALRRLRETRPVVPDGAKAGDLRWRPCTVKVGSARYAADCGTLVVSENRAQAGARLIALPVRRIRATGAAPAEPIFWLAGGPGASNMRFESPAALLANHDVVMVGYRGVDGSSVLACPEFARALRLKHPLSRSSLATLGDALRRCAERLRSEGVDLSAYTMLEVVGDAEAARAALGYERVNLLSASYGTRVAQIYAQRHPERIHRSAMIGVNPPGRFVWEPAMVDAQIRHYAALYARDPNLGAGSVDLAETVRAVVRDMPRRWLFVPIDADKVRVVTFTLLFHRRTAALVFDAYVAAARGDASGLALLSLAYDLVVPSSFVWGDLVAKAGSADYDPARDYAADMDPPQSILGSPVSKLQWSSIQAGGWPIEPLPGETRRAQPSDVETLLVSGSIDFSTPAQYATAELLPHLTRGRQVVLTEMGHTGDVWGVQPQATERLLTTFFDTGVADDSLYTHAPMDFHVPLGLPRLAKILLGTGVLVVAAAAVGIGSLARRLVPDPAPEA